MKYADIKGLSEGELRTKAKQIRQELFEARMKNSIGQLPNPMVIRVARKDMARLTTALTALKAKGEKK